MKRPHLKIVVAPFSANRRNPLEPVAPADDTRELGQGREYRPVVIGGDPMDWTAFESWCAVAALLAQGAATLSASVLARRANAIGARHRQRSFA